MMNTPALDAAAVTTLRTAITAAEDLRAVREQWGDLLAAIERPPAAQWPPRECTGFLDQLAAADDRTPAEPSIGRMPLVLREHPAPLNLSALDAALDTERDLFELADQIAEQAQRPVRRRIEQPIIPGRPLRPRVAVDDRDRDDPARWHLPTHSASVTARAASPGSRAYGLHWAAVWIEGRVMGEDIGDLFSPLPLRLLDQAAAVARRARTRVERALQRDGRTVTLDVPCPWCRGTLTGRTHPTGEPFVTCSNGPTCGAPTILDGGWRTWRGADLVALWSALDSARRRAQADAA